MVEARPVGQPKTLANKLDHLFKTVHPANRGEFSYREVAAAIEAQGGPTISASYIHMLRTGGKDNPTKRHIEGLARFFGVPPGYFFDDEEADKIDAQLEVLAAMRDAGVRNIALRAAGLTPRTLDIVRGMIESARQLDGLERDVSDEHS
jgi:hypothetical protein